MGLFSFFKRNKKITSQPDQLDYVPSFWEDDYCQVEIVPFENKAFIQKQAEQIDALAAQSKTEFGYAETFARGPMIVLTISKEIRVEGFENNLLSFGFIKAKCIRYENKLLNCEKGNIKALGHSGFTIFINTKDELVSSIWIDDRLMVSGQSFTTIESALLNIGEKYGLILIDWNRLEIFDLADKTQIHEYLFDSGSNTGD